MSNLPDKFQGIKLDHEGFKLSTRDREIALAMLLRSYTGETVEEVATRFDMSRDNVYRIMKKEEFSIFQSVLYEEIFKGLYGKAVLVLSDVLENAPTSQKLKAVQMILQASGKLKQEVTHEIKPAKKQTLEDLQREADILEMELELLEEKPRKIIDTEEME